MNQKLGQILAVLFIFLCVVDIFNIVPLFDGFVYWLYSVPSQSRNEKIIWFFITQVAISYLLLEFKAVNSYLKLFIGFGALLLFCLSLYKLAQVFIFIVFVNASTPNYSDSSLFATTLGKSLSLIMLIIFLYAAIKRVLGTMKVNHEK